MSDPSLSPPRVAYLINQYPKVSHSFIRREIQALERQGLAVLRLAVRGWNDALVDPDDLAERERTAYVLRGGYAKLLLAALTFALRHPARFFDGMRLALSTWRRSDRSLFHHLAYLAEACVVVGWLAEQRIDHLHAHFGTNPADVAMLSAALGGPAYSFTVHGPEEFDKPDALSLGEKARRAAFVVAISSFGRSQLYRCLPHAAWDRVEVVHCGLDPAFHRDAAVAGAVSNTLVCVGRLCEQKGQLLLVQALHRLVAQGVDVRLVLAGDGEMRAAIESLVASLGLVERVRITGWIGSAEVRAEILAARALVLPSFAEGLPVVLMEAMALRRPVVTTFVAGIPELVRDGVDGWLVAAGDVEALADAMRACLNAPAEQLARMGASAHEGALARHDIDREAAKLRALFAASSSARVAAGAAA
ncbi:MAG TPA: glycosyltransferase family 4 protein [Burkholderiaceae bacterium]|nr:glycosyltransferase family 4 protein [Burkholderiaceae bacterium]